MKNKTDKERIPADPEKWIDLYGDFLFRYTMLRLRDPAHAEDVVQETFLSAIQSRKNFESRSTERTWLIGILKHKIVDYFRKNSKELTVDDHDSFQRIVDENFDTNGRWKLIPGSWSRNSDEVVEQKEFWGVFRQCLTELPPRLANIYFLRELEEMSSQELCKVFNITATNLWVVLHRARHGLRECLATNWFEKN